jgi:hypothetical protein
MVAIGVLRGGFLYCFMSTARGMQGRQMERQEGSAENLPLDAQAVRRRNSDDTMKTDRYASENAVP